LTDRANKEVFHRSTAFLRVFPSVCLAAFLTFGSQLHAHEDGVHIKQGLEALEAQDFALASEEFSSAFDEGDPDGAFYLGRMLELGVGSSPNLQAAVGLYIAGSAKGSAASKNRLGVLHVQGNGVLQDYEQGAALVCEAADLGDVNGAYNCGSLTLEGRGVAQDEAKAYDWFRKAADMGHLGAKNAYANAMIEGKYVEQDVAGAVALFQQTAAEGNPVGLYALGQSFAVGLGVDQDLVKAHSYFNLASALGHPQAAGARAALEKQMSSEDVKLAQQRAKAWRPIQGENSILPD
jgi:TPR repeat protein|tara:strand:- start:8713 stop:9591 length:879 start_codon:yes stop_codon:yes gene_type:complete